MGQLWRWDVALQLTKQKTRHLWAVRRGNLHFFTWSCLNGLSERNPRVKEFPNGFWQEDKEAEHLQSSFAFVCSKSAKRKASSLREHLVEKFAKVNTNFVGNMQIDQGYIHAFSEPMLWRHTPGKSAEKVGWPGKEVTFNERSQPTWPLPGAAAFWDSGKGVKMIFCEFQLT